MDRLQQLRSKTIMVQVWLTPTNNIDSWIASKKDYAVYLVGFERCGSFWAISKEPNKKFRYLLSWVEQIERSGQRKTARIGQS